MKLSEKKCQPCEGGVPKLSPTQASELGQEIPDWEIKDEKLHKTFKFKNFLSAIEFINKLAKIAEEEGHHPNFSVDYNQVAITIWTHAIGGLSENDFILAAKLNSI